MHFLLFQGSHEPLRPSVVVGIAAATHADLDFVLFQQAGVLILCILTPRSEWWMSPSAFQLRSFRAIRSAPSASSASIVRARSHPMTRREYASRTTAR